MCLWIELCSYFCFIAAACVTQSSRNPRLCTHCNPANTWHHHLAQGGGHSTHRPRTLGLATAGTRWRAQYTPAPHTGPGNSWHHRLAQHTPPPHPGPGNSQHHHQAQGGGHSAHQPHTLGLATASTIIRHKEVGTVHTSPTLWAWQQLALSLGTTTEVLAGAILALAPHTLGPATAGTATTHKSGGQRAKVHIYGQHIRPALSLYTKMWAAPKVLKWGKCTETGRHSSHRLGTAPTGWWVHTRPTHTGLATATTNAARKQVGNAKMPNPAGKMHTGGVYTPGPYVYIYTNTHRAGNSYHHHCTRRGGQCRKCFPEGKVHNGAPRAPQ